MPVVDPTRRRNSPIQGTCIVPLDSLTSIPLAFQMHPSVEQALHPALQLLSFCSSGHLPAHLQLTFNAFSHCKDELPRILCDFFIHSFLWITVSTMNDIHKINLTDQELLFNHLLPFSWTFLSTAESL